ncbi:MAG: T9SS type A sorting domain-containing protein [Bacteroidia bacterium]|nr:T9SS type A sorting domain-containing protein [Bacteroidia bacterium]
MFEGEGVTNNENAPSPFPIGSYSTETASVNRNEILNFSIYPNPLTGSKLYINTSNNSEKYIQIYDVLGKQVFKTTLKGRELNVTQLTAGIYILKVFEEGKSATRKLVIK